MKIEVSYETVGEMLQLCRQLKEGVLDRDRLESLLDHEDYQLEFARYQGRVSREEFIEFFINFFDLNYQEITNDDFKSHYENYQYLFANLDLYERECQKLEQYTKEDFALQAEIAMKGLPEDVSLPELKFVFTISIGMSFGWVYGNCSHFDVIQLVKEFGVEDFKSAVAHEIHHIGMNKFYEQIDLEGLSLEELFYLYFSGEGLAVKYCNNAEGHLSKPIYKGETNVGLDDFTWEYLNNDFDDTYNHFIEHLEMIRSGKINSREELERDLIQKYWMDTHTKEQDSDEKPRLKHFRLYSFGNEIWGVIHDVFGKDKVFKTLRNLATFPKVYNEAVKKIGREEYSI